MRGNFGSCKGIQVGDPGGDEAKSSAELEVVRGDFGSRKEVQVEMRLSHSQSWRWCEATSGPTIQVEMRLSEVALVAKGIGRVMISGGELS